MRKLWKALLGVLVPLLVLTAAGIPAGAVWEGGSASSFASGTGTEAKPYVIKTEEQLSYFADQLNAGNTFAGQYLSLEADLCMTGGQWSVGASRSFAGTFLGNNHTIVINGRFLGILAEGGTVDWLNITSSITISDALLCKYNYGTIQNCRVRGDVYVDPGNAGLLCVYNYSTGTVVNSCGFGSVYGRGDDSDCYVGWIARNYGTIKSCYTVVSISGSAPGRYNSLYTGGITASGSFENCYTGSEVTANDGDFAARLNQTMAVPGYVWTVDTGSVNEGYPVIDDCLAAVTQLGASSDPMFTYHTSSLTTTLTCSESGCTVYYTLDGSDPTTSATRKKYSSSLTLTGDAVVTSVAYKNGEYGSPNTQYAIRMPGSGTASSPYQVSTNLGLYAIRFEPDKVYTLTADLDFTDGVYVHNGIVTDGWESIPAFSGTLNGGRHSITGLASTSGGLVNVNTGTIQELRLLDHRLCRKSEGYYDNFGPIANSSSGIITRCYAASDPNVTVYTDVMYNSVGGIVGYNSGTVSYCSSSGEIRVDAIESYSLSELAGIAGLNRGTVQSCYSDASLYGAYTSHDLGSATAGIAVGGKVYDCRYDGYCQNRGYDGWLGIAAYNSPGSSSVYADRTYDGGAVFDHSGKTHHYYGSNAYETTGSGLDRMELNFPAFDFDSVWMITEDGPMPQGIMNADGNYYTKKSYTAPGIDRTGATVCYVNGTSTSKTFTLSASGVEMGTHGDNLEWKRLADGSLIITGTGEMWGDDILDFPWYCDPVTDKVIAGDITSIVIGTGVTSVAPYAFYKSGATSISLPESVTTIGNYAFDRSSLTEITLPSSLTSVGSGVFYNLNGITVTFTGDAPAFAQYTFDDAVVTACYPADNTTWTRSVLRNYGGNVTWIRNGNCSHKAAWCVMQNVVSADCTNPGYSGDKFCTLCEETAVQGSVVDPLGHDEVPHEAQAPTCTAIGWEAYVTCTRCDYTTYEEREALGHDEVPHEAQAPTCTAIGWEAYVTCTRCDYTTCSEIGATGIHSYTSYTSNGDATCEADGTETALCDYSCGARDTRTDADSKLPHDYDPYGVCPDCGAEEELLPFRFAVSRVEGLSGSVVEVRISVEGNPGIIAATMSVSYDGDRLTLLEVRDTGLLSGGAFSKDVEADPFRLRWVDAMATENNTVNGDLAVLRFRVSEDCPSGKIPVFLTLTGNEIYNAELGLVTASSVNGCIEVVDYFTGDANHDGAVNSVDVTLLRRYLDGWDGVPIIKDAMDVNGDSLLDIRDVTVMRRYLAGWENVSMEVSGDAICPRTPSPADPDPIRFTVSDVSGSVGEEVTVTVSIANNPGIIAACMELAYDREKLELVSVEDSGLLRDYTFSQSYDAYPYALRWEDSLAEENNTANGVIATLKFRILEECPPGTASVTLSPGTGEVYNTDLDPVACEVEQGAVTIERKKMAGYDAATGAVTLHIIPEGTETVCVAAYSDGRLVDIIFLSPESGTGILQTEQADELRVFYLGDGFQPVEEQYTLAVSG